MLRFLTAGESHGPELTVIIDGLPAGIPFTVDDVNKELARRQKSAGSGGRMTIEKDAVRVTGGIMGGKTTGGPISLIVENKDFEAWKDRRIAPMTIPRPGHADLTAAIKYGYSDLRLGLERSSARETAARVAMGGICRKLLELFEIKIGSFVVRIGSAEAEISPSPDYERLFAAAEDNDVRCPDQKAASGMMDQIAQAKTNGDTVGGVFVCAALNVPPGLGSHVQWDRRLSARLMAAVASIPAIKGVEIGNAFENAEKLGTQVHDEIMLTDSGYLSRSSNRAGGFEGGITTGQPVVIRAAMKPISTTMKGLNSVDLGSRSPAKNNYERSDVCAVPRAAVVAEAMIAFVIADALIEKLGGDSLDEMLPRRQSLRTSSVRDLVMSGKPWNFGY